MKKTILVLVVLSTLVFSATSNRSFSFQGKILDNNGAAVTGTRAIAYELYSVSSGGSPLKTWTAQSTTVQNGLYTSELDMSGIDLTTGNDLYLSVIIAGEALTPRIHLTSSAYAQAATTANYAITAGTIKGLTYAITDSGAASFSSLVVSGTVTADVVIGTVWQ